MKLWIFGDSFAAINATDPDRVWPKQLTSKIASAVGHDVELVNIALLGCSQDWILSEFLSIVGQIQPEDYMVVVLTSAERYWFFDDKPELTNLNIIDIDEHVTKDQAKALEYYYKYIHRPNLRFLQAVSRISTIAYQSKVNGLRKPLIINAFDGQHFVTERWPDLDWAIGTLTEIQFKEYRDAKLTPDQNMVVSWFKGYDCRYNHLCLRNHDVLSDKLAKHLLKGIPADLKEGFHRDIITKNWYEDQQFIQDELDPEKIPLFMEKEYSRTNLLPWRIRVGLNNTKSAS